MEIPIYQVDAFSSSRFSGNPAAVCPLENWLPDAMLQSIAAENNLAETAFFVAADGRHHLRWFTPACEVDLCGHATLASAYVLFRELGAPGNKLHFDTKSGELTVRHENQQLVLDFPARKPTAVQVDPKLIVALGGPEPLEVLAARDHMVRYRSEAEVRALRPDMGLLSQLEGFATIVTAPGDDCDFVSRFFAPKKGIPEDPVTGSAHCTLVPYWSEKLQKTDLHARQVSARGGELFCRLLGNRVEMAGDGVLFLKGVIFI